MKVIVTVVPAKPIGVADAEIRNWRSKHPHVWAALRDEDIEVSLIRGGDEDGALIQKRRYRLIVEEEVAAKIALSGDNAIIEVEVASDGSTEEVGRSFEAWLLMHKRLAEKIAQGDIRVTQSPDGSRAVLQLSEHDAYVLAEP